MPTTEFDGSICITQYCKQEHTRIKLPEHEEYGRWMGGIGDSRTVAFNLCCMKTTAVHHYRMIFV